jgi:5-methylcytosine-specific restriction endonuclease McrA
MASKKTTTTKRPDHDGQHRKQYEINKKKIMASQNICGICGKPIDKSLKYPDKMAACVDHIIPIAKGGHPSDISNLQLAHWCCNRSKSDKIAGTIEDFKEKRERAKVVGNRNLPLSADWINY